MANVRRVSASFLEEGKDRRRIRVYDGRFGNKEFKQKCLETSGLDYRTFLQVLRQEFAIRSHENFVVVTTDRTGLDHEKFQEVRDCSTLLLLQNKNQPLSMPTKEHIKFTPHHNTLIEGGMFEYYASQGRNPLPYILAELIDNAVMATAKNTDARTIEIRMLFDENLGKPAIVVLDNGCGMTSKQLRNWAVLRLSKFTRENSEFASKNEGYVRPQPVRRSLNSDISFFGVGGKQAVFYIGDSTRMITKAVGSPDVHELVLSKEEFERKERDKQDVYTADITNRKPGDSSHVKKKEERFLHDLIAEESLKRSFTAVVVTGVLPEHITFLKDDFLVWTRQLAHVYHYYIYGENGNNMRSSSTNTDHLLKVDIQITLREKPLKDPTVLNLREVKNDMETLYINSAADTFEFQATVEKDGGTVEGVIRYHPFLFDRETYPQDDLQAPLDDDDVDDESGILHQARGKRPIFECFWQGRLIPNTTVAEFDWCSFVKGSKLPAECYSRISGVLFTNDRFQVSTNKLTFTDLELKLKKGSTIFMRVVNTQKQRSNMQKEFTQWLQTCHEKFDKQVEFKGYKETITRPDVPTKKMQHPWATFTSIEWDGKTYQAGQRVKSQKTQPIFYGTVVRFLLYGDHKGNVFATGGEVEVIQEPKALHDKTKTIAISKIDRAATEEVINANIENDIAKLPHELRVDWPEANPWPQRAVRPAGTPLGPLQVDIVDKKGESMSRMPSGDKGQVKKLVVELKIVRHDEAKGDEEIETSVAQWTKKWSYYFKKIGKLTVMGKYTLTLNSAINESNITVFGDRALPSYKLNFTIKEGNAASFDIGEVISTLRVGVPFNIPLLIKDAYGHPAMPPAKVKPELKYSDLELSPPERVDRSGTTLTIRGVKAKGKQSTQYNLKVTLPGMEPDTQSIKVVLLSGKPHSLHVTPEDDPITVENGNCVKFNIEVHDEAGNLTTHPKQIVDCQVQGLPLVATDCSNTGAGQLVTNPINVKIIKGEPQKLKVEFGMPSQKNVASVTRELKVLPSTKVSSMELYSQGDENLVIRNEEKIEWLAGGLLENLFYRLYDEACREVPLTAVIASKIKVNWTRDVNLEDLVQGKLPDLQVPTQVQSGRGSSFYQVSYHSVSVSFSITPRPDEPARLRVTVPESTVKLGETLPGNINLDLVDQYDNVTNSLTSTCVKHISVDAEGLDRSAISFKWQASSSSVLVLGVKFQSGTPGSRELSFTYGTYVQQAIIRVTAGVPAQLKLVSAPEQPLQVLNDRGIAKPFLVQLCDEWGNPSPDQRVVVELKCSPATLKVTTNVTSQPVNAEGKASFTVTHVSGQKGYYQLEFKGSFNRKPIRGPSVNLTVNPDPNKPVRLAVEYNTTAKFPAGDKFPVFYVTVVSDEGSPITKVNPAHASMLHWKGTAGGKTPPQTATKLTCSKPVENEKKDCFHFRDKDIPEEVGKHTIQFSLRLDGTKSLFSSQIVINVVPNQPVKLGPDSQPRTPVVSYSREITSRVLVEKMTLRIRDSYGNPTGEDLDGKVRVSIKNRDADNNITLPLFEGKTNSIEFRLDEGKTHIDRLAVMQNSPGEHGSSYILLFEPEVSMVSTPLAPFELLFRFSNDADNQRKMFELTRKKDKITTTLAAYKDTFATACHLRDLLSSSYNGACQKEHELKGALMRKNVRTEQHLSAPDLERLLTEKITEADRIQKMPRRHCSIQDHFKGQQDVLGMVGHLAFVQDDAAARVISWHIRGDMDCIITKTTTAAEKIYKDTQGRQQVLPLDSVFKYPNRPLPHMKNGRKLFEPPGNPVLARDLLIYPQEAESCHIVFKNLLRDTILMDDLHSANMYRKGVVQHGSQCPTILTRQGERVSAIGKFGGAQNKAPPMNALQVFGAPCPPQYYTLKEEIDLLSQYCTAVKKREIAAKECNDHKRDMESPENLRKQQEMRRMEQELVAIETQLASSSGRPAKRGPGDAAEPSGIAAKRGRP